ncbi:MAG TPA: hypothetical protein VHE55_16820 [Fimbriimonadaceae bacterium]|nr:hypothetical protein [Fimbriimonadaceae bacterium]
MIVVFLIGILAIVQIFPGGFRLLSTTQKNSQATALGRAEIETVKNHLDQLPDAIAPVSYAWNGSQWVITTQPNRSPNDLGPMFSVLDQNGIMADGAGNQIGSWQYLVGSNVGRRVLGEGRIIPAPRLIGGTYGSLMTLQFAPVIYNPSFQSLFIVYGNDLAKHEGDPISDGFNVRVNDFYVSGEDGNDPVLFIARNSAKDTNYRVSFTGYNPSTGRQDYVDVSISGPNRILQGTGPQIVHLNALVGPLNGIEYDSVKVERQFDQVASFSSDPYEYQLLSPQLGQVLFNPAGYNYVIRSHGRRTPLLGRVSYDVYDWRIIHDEFRMPDLYPAQYRLAIGGIKIKGESGPDGLPNQGIGVQAPDSSGAMHDVNLVLEDADTGGLYVFQPGTSDPHQTSFVVNGTLGLITFLDYDNDPANGTQLMLLEPGASTPTVVTVAGRNLRALYMGKNEWAVQVLKPSATYVQTDLTNPGIGQFFVPGVNDRIYFPTTDGGRVVSIGELYYYSTSGQEVGPVQLTAKIQTNNLDGYGQPYIPIQSYFPDFNGFDNSYGSAVKDVKGASVAVRVLWNPDYFTLTPDSASNMDHLDKWMQGWRRSTVETYLQRSN